MIRASFTSVTYADGETFYPPAIAISENGWVYKPDAIRTKQEIKRGTNKSWPRGSGTEDAKKYITDVVRQHFVDRNWELPISVDGYYSPRPERVYGDSLSLGWHDGAFGWVTLGIRVRQKEEATSWQYQKHDAVTYLLSVHPVLKWCMTKTVDDAVHGRDGIFSTERQVNNLTKAVNEWCADPIGVTEQHVTSMSKMRIPPQKELLRAQFQKDNWSDDALDTGVWSSSNDNGLYYRKGVIKKIMNSELNWEAISELIEALAFVGFDVSVHKTGYGANRVWISGVTIEVPEQQEMHHHRVHINAASPQVTIECGYKQDEARWLDYKTRKAVEEMAQLEVDLETTFEIDLGEEGVE